MCQTPNYENEGNNSCSSIPEGYSENNYIKYIKCLISYKEQNKYK